MLRLENSAMTHFSIPPAALERGKAYNVSCERFEHRCDLQTSATVTLVGYGASMDIDQGALRLKQGITHNTEPQSALYYKGVHHLKHIVILAPDGNISLAALRWCREQSIAVSIMNTQGELQAR